MENLNFTPDHYVNYLEAVHKKIAENKDYITELDAVTGDGDHWANLFMGFSKLLQREEELRQMTFRELFKNCGMELMSGIGGSSGVLYGSGYLAASRVADFESMALEDLEIVLTAQVEAIMKRGNSKPGYKTMIDPLYQGIKAMKRAVSEGADWNHILAALKEGAKKGMKDTAGMEAVRGRACYREDKGVGHLDPGAVTMYYQLELLADAMMGSEKSE